MDIFPKGLLDAAKQYFADIQPGGLLNPEVPKGGPTELAKGILGFTPVVGDAISAYDAVQSAREGDYLGAALNGVGVLPFVPSMAGVVIGGKIADALNATHGAKIDATLSEGKDVVLNKIVAKNRNEGDGTAFMRDLVSMADKDGKVVALSPASDFGGSKPRLLEFYKRFGFVPNKGKNKDFTISESMYRIPETTP